jgi:hypothetical protein
LSEDAELDPKKIILFNVFINGIVCALVYTIAAVFGIVLSVPLMIVGLGILTVLTVIDSKILWTVLFVVLFVLALHTFI